MGGQGGGCQTGDPKAVPLHAKIPLAPFSNLKPLCKILWYILTKGSYFIWHGILSYSVWQWCVPTQLHSPICVNQIHQQLLIQVHLQTQQKVTTGLAGMAVKVLKSDGVLGLYNGLSASVMRQVTI